MNDSSIKPISGVKTTEGNLLSKLSQLAQAESASQSQPGGEAQKAQTEIKIESKPNGSLSNISIHFRVDDETNDVTIFLVDRKTKKVLRSIPASELQKMQVGDILKLTA